MRWLCVSSPVARHNVCLLVPCARASLLYDRPSARVCVCVCMQQQHRAVSDAQLHRLLFAECLVCPRLLPPASDDCRLPPTTPERVCAHVHPLLDVRSSRLEWPPECPYRSRAHRDARTSCVNWRAAYSILLTRAGSVKRTDSVSCSSVLLPAPTSARNNCACQTYRCR